MKLEIRDRWVAALRSGDYPQTTGALQRTRPATIDSDVAHPGFCCLGVLCELAVEAGVIKRADDRGLELLGQAGYLSADRDGKVYPETALLPKEVVEWAGLDGIYGFGRNSGTGLTELNDNGVSFAAIADIIERGA